MRALKDLQWLEKVLNSFMESNHNSLSNFHVDHLVNQLYCGNIILIPTDTLPGLACLPINAHKIWKIKKRSVKKPLILMAASISPLLELVNDECKRDFVNVAYKYWPGALTLVLPTLCTQTQLLNPGGSTLGFRVPNCDPTLLLLKETGPLATSSANKSGENPLKSENDLAKAFPNFPMLAPLPWPSASGRASTVISWESIGKWKVLRQGEVNYSI